MKPQRLLSALAIFLLGIIMLFMSVRIILSTQTSNLLETKAKTIKQIELDNPQVTPPAQIITTPTYQDDMGAGILQKSPFSPQRSKFIRIIAPPRAQARPPRPNRVAPPPPPKTGRLLGILGRGDRKRAILAIDGDPAPLEVKLNEQSPLGKLIRIERSKIILLKDKKEIELSMF